jgi:hypothetical protein
LDQFKNRWIGRDVHGEAVQDWNCQNVSYR